MNPLFYIGTYTGDGSEGIYRIEVDVKNKRFTTPVLCAQERNPSYLYCDRNGLWGVNERREAVCPPQDGLFLYGADSIGNGLQRKHYETTGVQSCHLAHSDIAGLTAVTNYGDSTITVVGDGRCGRVIPHTGHGAIPGRQSAPHPHGTLFSEDGVLLYVADLGTDSIWRYETAGLLDGTGKAPTQTCFKPGDGPRQMVGGIEHDIIYCVCDLSGAVCTLRETGTELRLVQRLQGPSVGGAAIRRSPRGLIGCTFRGKSQLNCYTIQMDGQLCLAAQYPLNGEFPRDFDFVPDSDLVLIAYQRSNCLELCELDGMGGLTVCHREVLSNPVCVAIVNNREYAPL